MSRENFWHSSWSLCVSGNLLPAPFPSCWHRSLFLLSQYVAIKTLQTKQEEIHPSNNLSHLLFKMNLNFPDVRKVSTKSVPRQFVLIWMNRFPRTGRVRKTEKLKFFFSPRHTLAENWGGGSIMVWNLADRC